MKTSIRRLWSYLTPAQRWTLIFVTVANLIATIAVVAPSLIIGDIVNRLSKSHNASVIQSIALLIVLFALYTAIRAAVHITLHRVMPRLEATLREEQIRSALQAPVEEDVSEDYASEKNSLMGSGAKSAGDLIKITFADYVPAILQVSIATIASFKVSWGVGLLLILSGICSAAATQWQLRNQKGIRVELRNKKAHLDGAMTELLTGKPIVRTLNAVDKESHRVGRRAADISRREIKHHTAMGLFDALKMTIESGFGVVIVIIGIALVSAGSAPGTILSLYLLYMQFATPMREIHRIRDESSEAETQVERSLAVLDEASDSYFTRPTESHEDSVAVKATDVSIKYGDKEVISALDVTINDGSFIGICGFAGSGKSSFIKAVACLQSICQGEIFLYGTPHSKISASQFASDVAYISQTPYLIAASIKDNVKFGLSRDCSDDEVRNALSRIDALSHFEKHPLGIDRMLGEQGEGASGGERQLIVLARALLRQPRVIILDEATSSLDNVREAQFMRAVRQTGATVIAIAHRLTTLRDTDQIYVMDHGRFTESGTFEELSAAGGLFTDLLTASEHATEREEDADPV